MIAAEDAPSAARGSGLNFEGCAPASPSLVRCPVWCPRRNIRSIAPPPSWFVDPRCQPIRHHVTLAGCAAPAPRRSIPRTAGCGPAYHIRQLEGSGCSAETMCPIGKSDAGDCAALLLTADALRVD